MSGIQWTNLWLGDHQWQNATWAVKGLQAQLWLLASQRTPAGTIPDDDKWLRKVLSLPTSAAAARAKKAVLEAAASLPQKASKKNKKNSVNEDIQSDPLNWTEAHARVLDALFEGKISEELQDAQQESWLDHLWVNHWKKQLLEGWTLIDEKYVETHPEFKKALGGWFHPLPALMSQGNLPSELVSSKKSPAAKIKKDGLLITESAFDSRNHLKPNAKKALQPWWGNMDEARLLQLWSVPLSKEEGRRMWETGVSYLAVGGRNEAQAKTLLGKLIKIHGEAAVDKAIKALAMRVIPPSDGFLFLQGVLTQQGENGGSPAEQKARGQRAKVAL